MEKEYFMRQKVITKKKAAKRINTSCSHDKSILKIKIRSYNYQLFFAYFDQESASSAHPLILNKRPNRIEE